MSWGRFHRAPFPSGMPAMSRCSRHKAAPPTVVVIDVDDDLVDGSSDEDVCIIDGAAGKGRAASGCKTKKGDSSCSNVINIDDDEDEEEGGGGVDRAGPSTARAAGSTSATTPGCVSPRNRYGLDYVSDSYESDSSEGWNSDGDGNSDCEILDDTSEMVRKQWEKAASRKSMPQGPQNCRNGMAGTFASSDESSAQQDENDNPFRTECHINEGIWKYFSDVLKEGVSDSRIDATFGGATTSMPNGHGCPEGNVSTGNEAEACNATSRFDPKPACNDKVTHSQNGAVPEKPPERSQSPQPYEALKPEERTGYSFVSANRVFAACSADWNDVSHIFVRTPENLDETPNDAHTESTRKNKETCSVPDNGPLSSPLTEDPPFSSRCGCSWQSGGNSTHGEANCCSSAAASNKNPSTNVILGDCGLLQKDLVDCPDKSGQPATVQDAPNFQYGLIGEREKHKESDEYKRAEEEEWASRQRQLAIQAEEAQRLRKRKKAEALRLLDMEKRQKQRLEEVRESQRKNEEDIQLKEKYRGVVRLELEDMERRYIDMVSILRALGIPVESGEVKAAYKQALLKFHPDRVSRSDMFQQVKAEETFKFISRLKEKLIRVF